MDRDEHTPPDTGGPMNLHVDLDGDGRWCVSRIVDGRPQVVSTHATRERAEQAMATIPAAGGRQPDA